MAYYLITSIYSYIYTGLERKSVDIHKDQSNGIEINKSGYMKS